MKSNGMLLYMIKEIKIAESMKMKPNTMYTGCHRWGPSIHATNLKDQLRKGEQNSLLFIKPACQKYSEKCCRNSLLKQSFYNRISATITIIKKLIYKRWHTLIYKHRGNYSLCELSNCSLTY